MTDIQFQIKAAIERYLVADTQLRLAHSEKVKVEDRLQQAVGVVLEALNAVGEIALPGKGVAERMFDFGGSVVRVARLPNQTVIVEVVRVEELK